jgi:hypothetical protein
LKVPPDFLVAMKRPEYEFRFTHRPVVAFFDMDLDWSG